MSEKAYADSLFNRKMLALVETTSKLIEEMVTVKLSQLKMDVAGLANESNAEQIAQVNKAIQELEIRSKPCLEKIRKG